MEKEPRSPASAIDVDERRQHQRIAPEGAMVQLASPDKTTTLAFSVDNLSEGGALIAGRIDVEPGTTLALSILLPGAGPIALPARILRHVVRGGKDFTAVMFLKESHALGIWIGDVVLQGLRAAFPEI